MLNLKLTFHASCPKHPCYQPQQEGKGAIKGGCIYCEALYRISQTGAKVTQAVTEFQELLDRYEQDHPSRTPRKKRAVIQPTLFQMGAGRL